MTEPIRHVFLGEVSNSAARMAVLQGELTNLCSEYSAVKASVDQRLKWAVGANPGLQEVADQLSGQHQAQVEIVRQLGILASHVTDTGQAELQWEVLRTNTAEARTHDHQFLGILASCRESCVNATDRSTDVGLSSEETQLLDVNPPKERIDQFWIRQTEGLIATRVKAVQEQVAALNRRFADLARVIQEIGLGLKDICTVHHKLMADVAILLRTINRMENFEFPALSIFLSRYKEYSELLNHLVKDVLNSELTMEGGQAVVAGLEGMKEETGFIYDELINIAAVAS